MAEEEKDIKAGGQMTAAQMDDMGIEEEVADDGEC